MVKKCQISLNCQLFSIPQFFSTSLPLFYGQVHALEKPGLTFRSSIRKLQPMKLFRNENIVPVQNDPISKPFDVFRRGKQHQTGNFVFLRIVLESTRQTT